MQDGFKGIKILDLEDNVKSMKMSDASNTNRSSNGNGSGPGYNDGNGDATSLYQSGVIIANRGLIAQLPNIILRN